MEKEKKQLLLDQIAHDMEAPQACIEQDTKLNGLKPLPNINYDELERELRLDHKEYQQMIERGKMINKVLENGEVDVEGLSKHNRKALDMFIKRKPIRDYTDIVLRAWQKDAIKFIDTPTERQVIWITGTRGNEGKSWFQGYLHTIYSYNRVARVDLRVSHKDICNVLRKCPLPTIDIFLFNDSRSSDGHIYDIYKMLEDIKDGQATGSKFNNDNLTFKIPNTVMIFSNKFPKLDKLSQDRWIVYNANQAGLNNVTECLMKMKKAGYNNNEDSHLDIFGFCQDNTLEDRD